MFCSHVVPYLGNKGPWEYKNDLMSGSSFKSTVLKCGQNSLLFYTSSNNKQSPSVSERKRWATGEVRLRLRSSSVCGTVHGRWILNLTHTACSPCPFYFTRFPNVPVRAPTRLWGEEREVTTGQWRHWRQPSTPWPSISTHLVESITVTQRTGWRWITQ